MNFEDFWLLVGSRGRVAHFYRSECEYLWNTFSPEKQEAIYDAINEKLQAGKFVHFNPANAIRDNAPKAKTMQILSFNDYYAKFGTTEEQGGWKMQFLKDQGKTIYVKNH